MLPAVVAVVGIVGGTADVATDAVVALEVDGQLHCSGVVISPSVVVTAAHCIPTTLDGLAVVVGWSLDGPRLELPAIAALAHPSYDGMEHDIGLVVVADTLPVPPLELATPAAIAALTVGANATVVGFGRASDGTAGMKQLATMHVAAVAATHVDLVAAPGITCDGDSGGPLLITTPAGPRVAAINSLSDCVTRAREQRVDTEQAFIAGVEHPICTGDPCSADVIGGCSTSGTGSLASVLSVLAWLARRGRHVVCHPSKGHQP